MKETCEINFSKKLCNLSGIENKKLFLKIKEKKNYKHVYVFNEGKESIVVEDISYIFGKEGSPIELRSLLLERKNKERLLRKKLGEYYERVILSEYKLTS